MIYGTETEGVDHAMLNMAGVFSSHPAFGENGFDLSHPDIRLTGDFSSPDLNKPMLEIPFIMTITNPRDRLVYCKPIDIFNLVGLWVYLLSGSEEVGPIEYYNPVARRFVDEEVDAKRLRATWGARLFGTGSVARCIALLQQSPQTRRAIIPVLDQSDVGYASRNLPCLASIQFAMQAGQLNAYVTMRSQAAVGVMPYDLFLLTMLHEYVAMRSGLPLGSYTHFAPLCGIRQNEIPIITHMLQSRNQWFDKPMPEMEPLQPGHLALFLACERAIRRGVGPMGNKGPLAIMEQLPRYWRDLLVISQAKKEGILPLGGMDIYTFPETFIQQCIQRELARR